MGFQRIHRRAPIGAEGSLTMEIVREGDLAGSMTGGSTAGPEVPVDYRRLVEQIPAITYTEVHERRGAAAQRTTFVSPQVIRILGHAPSEFVEDPELWRTLRHPADRARVLAAERTAEVTRRPFRAEYRMRTRDGRMLWFRDEAVIVDREGGGGTIWQGVMVDITTEKEAVEQARRAELRYRSLVESLPAIVYIDELDERASNVYTSPRTEPMLGYTARDWQEVPDFWVAILHPEDRDRAVSAQRLHVESGEPFEQTYRLIARDGRVVWVRDVATVVTDEDGTPLYSQGFLLDITEQKRAEERLRELLPGTAGQPSEQPSEQPS